MSTYDGLRFVYLVAQRGLVPGLGVGFQDYPIAPGLLSPWDFPLEDEVTTPRQPEPARPKVCGKLPDTVEMRRQNFLPEEIWAAIQAYSDACELDFEIIAPCKLTARPAPVCLLGPESQVTSSAILTYSVVDPPLPPDPRFPPQPGLAPGPGDEILSVETQYFKLPDFYPPPTSWSLTTTTFKRSSTMPFRSVIFKERVWQFGSTGALLTLDGEQSLNYVPAVGATRKMSVTPWTEESAVILPWYTDWPREIQTLSNYPPMRTNPAPWEVFMQYLRDDFGCP